MSFYQELQRRNVIKATISYLVVSWLVLQVIDVLFPIFEISLQVQKWVFIVLAIGFPIWIVFAYIYELTPEGFKKTDNVAAEDSINKATSRKLNIYIISGLILVIIVLLADRFLIANPKNSNTKKTIAVLPFENLSAEEDKYFTSGMAEDILSHISQISNIKVLSSFTLRQYDDKGKSPKEIGDELGVSHILVGNVRRSDGRVRIGCQLISTSEQDAIWVETYDKQITDVFQMQSEIAADIANSLSAKILDKELIQKPLEPTKSLEAYDIYLQARDYFNLYQENYNTDAIELFRQSVKIDPNFSLGYAGLADAYGRAASGYGNLPYNYVDSALALAQKSVDIEPRIADNWKSLGYAYRISGKIEESVAMYQKALEINPNHSSALNGISRYYVETGRADEAIKYLKKQIQLEPLNFLPYNNLGVCYWQLGFGEESLKVLDKASSLSNTFLTYYNQACAYLVLKDTLSVTKVLEEVERNYSDQIYAKYFLVGSDIVLGVEGDGVEKVRELKKMQGFDYRLYPGVRNIEAHWLLKENKHDSARMLLKDNLDFYLDQMQQGNQQESYLIEIAEVYALLDDKENAINWIQKKMDTGWTNALMLRYNRLFDSLYNEPEFKKILSEMDRRVDEMRQKVIDLEASEQMNRVTL